MGPINPLVVSCPLCHLLHVSLDVSLCYWIPTVNLFGKFWKACFVSYWDNTCDHCCKLCFVNHYCISNDNKELNWKNNDARFRIYINEDLTKKRDELMKKCRELRKGQAINDWWSFAGNIYIKDKANKVTSIKSDADLCDYYWWDNRLIKMFTILHYWWQISHVTSWITMTIEFEQSIDAHSWLKSREAILMEQV